MHASTGFDEPEGPLPILTGRPAPRRSCAAVLRAVGGAKAVAAVAHTVVPFKSPALLQSQIAAQLAQCRIRKGAPARSRRRGGILGGLRGIRRCLSLCRSGLGICQVLLGGGKIGLCRTQASVQRVNFILGRARRNGIIDGFCASATAVVALVTPSWAAAASVAASVAMAWASTVARAASR